MFDGYEAFAQQHQGMTEEELNRLYPNGLPMQPMSPLPAVPPGMSVLPPPGGMSLPETWGTPVTPPADTPPGQSPYLNPNAPMQEASVGGGLLDKYAMGLGGGSQGGSGFLSGLFGGGGDQPSGGKDWGSMLMALGGGIAQGAQFGGGGWGGGLGQGFQNAAAANMRSKENAKEDAYRQERLRMKKAEMGDGKQPKLIDDPRGTGGKVWLNADNTFSAVDTSSLGEAPAQYAIGDTKDRVTAESGMRKEFTQLSGNYVEARNAYTGMVAAAADPSPAGDMAVIYGFMKQNDPRSTVREGEYATAQNAASVPGRIRALYNSVVDGTKLTAEQRADFIKQGGNLFKAHEKSQKRLADDYRKKAASSGVNPDNVIVDFSAELPEVAPEAPVASAPAQAPAMPTTDAGVLGGTTQPKRRRWDPATNSFIEVPMGQ
jgi:hypothetical protein